MKYAVLSAAAGLFLIAGCGDTTDAAAPTEPAPAASVETVTDENTSEPQSKKEIRREHLKAVLKSQPKETKARYKARQPRKTIEFFRVTPGMTVVEALPGGGWYSKILIPYLGPEGTLIGGQYPDEMWAKFGFGDEWAAKRIEASNNWATTATEWGIEDGASIRSATLTAMPADASETVDAVLFIRALHNLSRFNEGDAFLDTSISEAYRVLKPGGIVGVVQHAAAEDAPDESTKGQRGYLKQSTLVAQFEAAGFVFEKAAEFNANASDQPGADQVVWRLPPSLNGTEEGTPERAAMEAIGESNRMTLRFRKPK